MIVAPIPENEEKRLASLRIYDILDTEPERCFDDITLMASSITQMPIALVSLVDEDRQWFKSKIGLDVCQTSRDISFCGHAIHQSDIMIVSDTYWDPRFADNPLVISGPMIRFYAGAPIITSDGAAVGTVCVIDTKPHSLSEEEANALEALARQVSRLLDARLTLAKLRQTSGTMTRLVESSLDMIVAVDSSHQVTMFNNAAQRTFGYAEADVLDKRVMDFFADPDAALPFYRTLKKKGKAISDILMKKKNGESFPCLVSASRLTDAQGNPAGFMGVLHDMTEAKQIEAEKNNFVSTVNHELRTPLTSITASLGLISEGIVGDVSVDVKGLVDIAYGSCNRLVRLVNDMLDLERIESGSMRFTIKPIDVEPLLHQALAAINGYAVTFSVGFKIQIDCPDSRVMADPDRLTQVLVNLLSNATKFSPLEGEVEITVSRNRRMVRFAIADRGPGIPKEFHARVFHKFSQVEMPDRRTKGGSGLGLSICKSIVEQMGGRIWFESELQRGTTFFFELPEGSIHG